MRANNASIPSNRRADTAIVSSSSNALDDEDDIAPLIEVVSVSPTPGPSHGGGNYSAAKPTESDTSDDSYLDSLEEGRTPLLLMDEDYENADEDDDDLLEKGMVNAVRNYSTTTAQRRSSPTALNASVGRETGGDEELEATNTIVPTAKRVRRIPKERLKTLLAGILLGVTAASNDIVLSFIHEYVPLGDPLPDVSHNLPYWPWALSLSEYLMLTLYTVLMLITIFHRHRWVVARRIATVASLLYACRSITMLVTQVPVADPNYYCAPKFAPEDRTFWNILWRGMRVLTGLGLNINGKHTLCGDYIYSGHTIVHVTCYLFIKEYSPRRWQLLHYMAMVFSIVGVTCLLVSRGHYTIDVIIAYWITTRVFWQYHTMADVWLLRTDLQGRNHLTKVFWYPLFRFMEANVHRPLPRKYGLPLKL